MLAKGAGSYRGFAILSAVVFVFQKYLHPNPKPIGLIFSGSASDGK